MILNVACGCRSNKIWMWILKKKNCKRKQKDCCLCCCCCCWCFFLFFKINIIFDSATMEIRSIELVPMLSAFFFNFTIYHISHTYIQKFCSIMGDKDEIQWTYLVYAYASVDVVVCILFFLCRCIRWISFDSCSPYLIYCFNEKKFFIFCYHIRTHKKKRISSI